MHLFIPTDKNNTKVDNKTKIKIILNTTLLKYLNIKDIYLEYFLMILYYLKYKIYI